MRAKLIVSLFSVLVTGLSISYLYQPATTTSLNPNIAIIHVPRSNHLDEYILLWSPWSNGAYYPLIPDYVEFGDKLLTYKHNFKMPAFGYWQVVKQQ